MRGDRIAQALGWSSPLLGFCLETRNGLVAVLNDLHKGRDSGRGWSVVIDVSAVLLTLVSLTGLLLLFFVYKRRTSGLILAAAGAAVCWMVWMRYVP